MAAASPGPDPRPSEALLWLLFAAALSVFAVLYFALFDVLGIWTSLLFVLLLTVAAMNWGLRGGLIAGVLSFPFNWSLALLASGAPPAVRPEHVLMAVAGIVAAASIGFFRDSSVRYRRLNAELGQANARLTEALADVETLSGLIPICAECGKMRNDKGYWLRIEEYMRGHTALRFSHGLCPDCMQRLYPGAAEAGESPPDNDDPAG